MISNPILILPKFRIFNLGGERYLLRLIIVDKGEN